jgi:predicted acetyltransferase
LFVATAIRKFRKSNICRLGDFCNERAEDESAFEMKIIKVDNENLPVYLSLRQSYEGEFSAITDKKPDENGLFELDTQVGGNVLGYLLYEEKSPIGLAAVKAKSGGHCFEVCEFYVVPSFRKQALGKQFAIEIFKMHQGCWEIKQISGAEYATEFWRKTVGEFTGNDFQEDVYQDEYWGQVVRQQFVSTSPDPSKELKA